MKKIFIILILGITIMNGCINQDTICDYYGETFTGNSTVPYTYTIYRDLRGCDNSKILYYLHGSDGDETTWIKTHGNIINEWRITGRPSPVVVGISFGRRWLLTPKYRGKERSGYLEIFINSAIPEIESRLGNTIKHRFVMGISMGGFSAAQLAFRYPELFEKGVIVSPLIYPFSIYSDKKTIDAFILQEDSKLPGLKHWIKKNILRGSNLQNSVYQGIGILQTVYFPDEDAWNSGDIMKNIKKSSHAEKNMIYISCGTHDENGFYPGSELLASIAGSFSYSVTWRSLDAGHMAIDEKEIAGFLMQ